MCMDQMDTVPCTLYARLQVGLDREARAVQLSDGSELAYDLLLIACGLQEQTCNEMVSGRLSSRANRQMRVMVHLCHCLNHLHKLGFTWPWCIYSRADQGRKLLKDCKKSMRFDQNVTAKCRRTSAAA